MLKFNRVYFYLFVVIFVVEVMIALYVRDAFIRPYLGDTLVVILIYCFIRSFINSPVYPSIIAVLLFAFGVEVMQYFNFVDLLGLSQNKIARIVLGSSFSWGDMIAYSAGAVVIAFAERVKN